MADNTTNKTTQSTQHNYGNKSDNRTKRAQELVPELADYVDKMARSDGKSADFVEDMKARLEKYGNDTYVSEKQLNWLESLAERWLG